MQKQLSAAWTLSRQRKTAVCSVWSHQFGWELRIEVDPELIRSQVVRSNGELSDVTACWREAMTGKGWTGHST